MSDLLDEERDGVASKLDLPEADPLERLRAPVPGYWAHRFALIREYLAVRVGLPIDWYERALGERSRTRTLPLMAGAFLLVILVVSGGVFLIVRNVSGTEPRSSSLRLAAPANSAVGIGSGSTPGLTSIPMATTTTKPVEVAVHAAGAVVTPGLYRLTGSPRVADLIDAAGGLASDADVDRINLAAPLSDGDRLYVPHRGEANVPTAVGADGASGSGGSPSGSSEPSASNPLNLNSATAEQLDALPGVGPATAKAIVDHRSTHGPFASVDGLLEVRGIGPAKLEAIRGLVTV